MPNENKEIRITEKKIIDIEWEFDGIEEREELQKAINVLSKYIGINVSFRGYTTQIILKVKAD